MATAKTAYINSCIIVCTDKKGHLNQCLALSEKLAWSVEEIILITDGSQMDSIALKAQKLVKRTWNTARAWPWRKSRKSICIIASGRSSEIVLRAYRRLYGGNMFALFIGSPKSSQSIFDIALASNHAAPQQTDYVAAKHTHWISGVLVRATKPSITAPSDSGLVFLIGGTNKAFELEQSQITTQIELLLKTTSDQNSTIIFSRRTPIKLEEALRSKFSQLANLHFVDRNDRVGFEVAMTTGSQFIVTPDSITMICEATATKKPVSLFNLPCFNEQTSTYRFVKEFSDSGRVKLIGSHSLPTKAKNPHGEIEPAVKFVAQEYSKWVRSIGLAPHPNTK